jgi:hypothetical protein
MEEKEEPKSYTEKSIDAGKRHAKELNTKADYRAASVFLTKVAPQAAAKHLDLALKNRKDNQQRK